MTPQKARGVTTPCLVSETPDKAGNSRAGGAGGDPQERHGQIHGRPCRGTLHASACCPGCAAVFSHVQRIHNARGAYGTGWVHAGRARNHGPEEPDGTDVPGRPGSTDPYDCPSSLCGRGDPTPDHAGANHGKGRQTWSRPSRRKPVGEGPHYGDMDSRWSKSFPHPEPNGFRPNWTTLHGGEGCTGSVHSHSPATGGIRLGGVVAADVGDAIRIDDLRGIKIPYYDGNPSNLDDFILDWEDFAEEVVGEMKGAPRDKLVWRTFPQRLAQDLKEELRDQIRERLIQTEQACLQWLEDEERVDAPNQKSEDLWFIPLPLERGELRVREWNRYICKYRRSLKLVEEWNGISRIGLQLPWSQLNSGSVKRF